MSERGMSSMSMGGMSPFGAVERCRLFEGLDRSDLMSAAMAMRPRTLATGEALYHEGEPGDRLFVIVDGVVQVVAEGAAPAKLRRGEVTGATALVTGEPNAATAVAATPTEVLELDRAGFEALTQRHPVVLVNAMRVLSRRLARTRAERGEAVALIFSAGVAPALPAVLEAAAAAGPGSLMALDTRAGFHEAIVQLDDRLAENGTVVVTARAEGRSAPLLLDHVDHAVALVEAIGDADRFPGIQVVLAGDGPSRPGTPPVARILERGEPGGPLPPAETAWLGRLLTRTRLGLALGAGGAKGYAHVGALAVLEQAGYTVDAVAGSSIGAIVGAYLALGMDAAAIDRTLREAFNPETVAETFQLSLAGMSTGLDAMTRIFKETTRELTFADLRIPFAAMAVDLESRAPAPQHDGPLWDALLAATALAGMFPPHQRDGQRLVDGLALVPVPTGAAYEAGADVVVSVNLMPREALDAWPGQEPPPPPAPRRRRGVRMLETILEVMDVSSLEDSNRHAELADVVINPRFGPASWRDFHLADLFEEAGRAAAAEQLANLKTLARPQAFG